jgi:hypothetical protein
LSAKLAAMGGALSIVLAVSGSVVPGAEAKPNKVTTRAPVKTAPRVVHTNLRQTHANFGHNANLSRAGQGTRTGGTHAGGSGSTNVRQTRANFGHNKTLSHAGGGTGTGAGSGTTNTGVQKVVRQNGNQGGSGTGTANTGTQNTGNTKVGSLNPGPHNTGTTNTGNTKTGTTNTGTTNNGNTKTGTTNTGNTNAGTPKTGPNVLPHGPSQPVKVTVNLTVRPTYPAVHLHNVNAFFPIHRAPYAIFIGGVARTFVPLAALGIARINGGYWNPDGYVRVARRFCQGVAENGCMLYWRNVDFAGGGGSDAQCVQYCPHTGPAPANFVEAPPQPPAPPANASCDLTIFGEANFGGSSAPTGQSQPDVSATGWQNAISSIQIQSGVWDFFTDANFSGESMRLQAGQYATLPQGWDKKIASFQCVQRSVASAQ